MTSPRPFTATDVAQVDLDLLALIVEAGADGEDPTARLLALIDSAAGRSDEDTPADILVMIPSEIDGRIVEVSDLECDICGSLTPRAIECPDGIIRCPDCSGRSATMAEYDLDDLEEPGSYE